MYRSLYSARGWTYKVELLPDTLDFKYDQRHKQQSGYGLWFHLGTRMISMASWDKKLHEEYNANHDFNNPININYTVCYSMDSLCICWSISAQHWILVEMLRPLMCRFPLDFCILIQRFLTCGVLQERIKAGEANVDTSSLVESSSWWIQALKFWTYQQLWIRTKDF